MDRFFTNTTLREPIILTLSVILLSRDARMQIASREMHNAQAIYVWTVPVVYSLGMQCLIPSICLVLCVKGVRYYSWRIVQTRYQFWALMSVVKIPRTVAICVLSFRYIYSMSFFHIRNPCRLVFSKAHSERNVKMYQSVSMPVNVHFERESKNQVTDIYYPGGLTFPTRNPGLQHFSQEVHDDAAGNSQGMLLNQASTSRSFLNWIPLNKWYSRSRRHWKGGLNMPVLPCSLPM